MKKYLLYITLIALAVLSCRKEESGIVSGAEATVAATAWTGYSWQEADAIGVSNFPYALLEKAARDFPIEYHERPLSLIWTKDYGKEKESGMKILAYSPLGMGILSGKYSSASDFSDSRKNLYLFSSPYTEQLLEQLRNNPSIALSWTYMQRPFGVISGFSSEDDIDVLNKIKPLDEALYSTLSDLSAKITGTAFSDNLFAHRWN